LQFAPALRAHDVPWIADVWVSLSKEGRAELEKINTSLHHFFITGNVPVVDVADDVIPCMKPFPTPVEATPCEQDAATLVYSYAHL
jgi:hypothetical protein